MGNSWVEDIMRHIDSQTHIPAVHRQIMKNRLAPAPNTVEIVNARNFLDKEN